MARRVKYHINPTTMQPNVCKAKPGNCPYGDSPHYDTFDEAQRASQEKLSNNYGTLPVTDELDDYSDWVNKFYEWDKLDDTTEVEELLRTTEDGDLMYSMINRISSLSDNQAYMNAFLENPNLPTYFLERISKGPAYFNVETQRKMAKNPSMSSVQLLNLFKNSTDEETRFEVCQNKNLTDEACMALYNDRIVNLHYKPTNGLLYNSSFPEQYRNEYYRELLAGAFFEGGKYNPVQKG